MTGCHSCRKKLISRKTRYDRENKRGGNDHITPDLPGCAGLEETCTNKFPYPFTDFPIYILTGNNYLEASQWRLIFPEAILVYDFEQIKINLSNLGEGGALVINATSTTALCRDLFLNTVTTAINIFRIKGYNGFYIDDYFDSFPDKTTISELTPRQSINIASIIRVDPALRSYWIGNFSNKFVLEGQLFPQLVNHIILHTVEPPINNFGLIIAIIFIFLMFIYWISILVWY